MTPPLLKLLTMLAPLMLAPLKPTLLLKLLTMLVSAIPFGREAAPFVAEVKARGNGSGFAMLEKWLGEYQALFLRRNRADPLVILPWSTWVRMLEKVRRS